MSDFTIREARIDDISGMMAVEQAGFPSEFHEPEEMFLDIVQNAMDTCHVAVMDQTIIGYLMAHPSEEDRDDYVAGFHLVNDTDVMFLHDLCVHPKAQALGVGRALFDRLKQQSKTANFSKIIGISVGDAAPYWEKLGFTMIRPYPYNGEAGQYMMKEI